MTVALSRGSAFANISMVWSYKMYLLSDPSVFIVPSAFFGMPSYISTKSNVGFISAE